jgi:TRAP-type C4-dicarboxylate transport system permease large subunit
MFLSGMTVSYLIPFLKYHGHNPERHVALGKVSASNRNLIPPKMVLVGIRRR